MPFISRKVVAVDGDAHKFDKELLINCPLLNVMTYGKEFLLCFPDMTVRIHFQLFGSYTINERKKGKLRLGLYFNGDQELNFYSCDVSLLTAPLNTIYDWSVEVMHEDWNPANALKKLQAKPKVMIADALLDQSIFAGVGNTIKDELLYDAKVHPESLIENIPKAMLKELTDDCVAKSFQYLDWEKADRPKGFLMVHRQKECPVDHKFLTVKEVGKAKRKSYFCDICQKLYGSIKK